MSQPAKRKAEEAFKEDLEPVQKSHKKFRRRRKERRGSDAPQLHAEVESQEKAVDAETASVSLPAAPLALTLTPVGPPHQNNATNPTKLKMGKRKSEQTTSEPKGTIEQAHDVAAALSAQNVGESAVTKKKKTKKHRMRESGAGVDDGQLAATEVSEVFQKHQNNDAESAQPLHPQEAKHERKKKKHKGKGKNVDANKVADKNKPAAELASTEADGTRQGIPEANDETPAPAKKTKKNSKRKRGRAARKQQEDGGVDLRETGDAQESSTAVPLEDRIEPPPEDGTTNVEDPTAESEEQDSDSEAGQGAELNGLVPLEARIEAPAEMKIKPKKYQKGWSVSAGVGGVFVDHDPILTADDEHLILPTQSDVRIYSQSTSLLVRKLQPRLRSEDDYVVSCVQSASNPAHLLLATHSGDVSLWDWTQGERIKRWKSRHALGQILSLHPKTKTQRVLAVHGGHQQKETTLSILDLDPASYHPVNAPELLKRKGLDVNVRLFENTGVIVATTRKHLLIGYCPGFGTDDQSPSSFYWRELSVPSTIVSFDARSVDQHRAGNTPRVNIAVGVESGEIMLYEDLLFKMIGKEKQKTTVEISARILHWHRSAVSSVKWSRDGNYLISGGSETVLVIWNLDTNEQQHLPHLSSEILNISVSPKGSSYGLRLSDNSVMVLSTANLDVTTNVSGFAGVQSPDARLAVSLHPTSPDRLLVTVPRNPSRIDQSAFALQTYDLNTDRELGRQALTRNSTTVVTTQSSGSSNLEPDVTHICLSADGKWLATVEEWHADPQDLDGVTLTSEDDVDDFGAEICLKIWLYNEQQSEWELVNRIDNPHSRGSTKVLALESCPTRNEFATAGSDGKVKTWRPRARVRDGVPVRNESGEQLYNWSQMTVSSCTVPPPAQTGRDLNSAALAYSPDGTVIAASWSQASPQPRWTYLLDNDDGKICHSAPDLVSHGAASMVFSDRYLVSLSETICVYDTVSGTTVSKTRLESKYSGENERGYLAASIMDGTVAIAVNSTTGKAAGRLAVIEVKNLERSPLFEQEIPAQIHALLTSPSVQGYVTIDGNSKISRVRRTGKKAVQSITTAGEVKEPDDVRKGLDRIFGQVQPPPQLESSTMVGGKSLMAGEENTTRRTLEDVLNFQTSAEAPGVGELFERIAGLFARPAVAVQ